MSDDYTITQVRKNARHSLVTCLGKSEGQARESIPGRRSAARRVDSFDSLAALVATRLRARSYSPRSSRERILGFLGILLNTFLASERASPESQRNQSALLLSRIFRRALESALESSFRSKQQAASHGKSQLSFIKAEVPGRRDCRNENYLARLLIYSRPLFVSPGITHS